MKKQPLKTRTPTCLAQVSTQKLVRLGQGGDLFNATLTQIPSEATIFHKGDDANGLEYIRKMIESQGNITGLKLVPVKIEVFFD